MNAIVNQYALYFIRELKITMPIFCMYLLLACLFSLSCYILFKVKNLHTDLSTVKEEEKSSCLQESEDIHNINDLIIAALVFIFAGCRVIHTCLQEHTLFYFFIFLFFNIITISSFLQLFSFVTYKHEYHKNHHESCDKAYKENKTENIRIKGEYSVQNQTSITLNILSFFLIVTMLFLIVVSIFFAILPCIFFVAFCYTVISMITKITARI